MANPSTSLRSSCAAPGGCKPKLTCLCSPTNHPGSFRCSRHRSPLSSSGRVSQQVASTSGASATGRGEGIIRSSSVGSGGRTAKGRSILRAHLLGLVSPPSSGGNDHRRCRDFKPRPSRLGRLAVTV
ncbi:hypothetical protein VPH35_118940 [Triticum aestivum]|uniref:uncharacterized protein n=1 Tax=Triticum aestivum TaxID=4565 RepID=UPI001D02C33D|nr:uncharacterized protein LOC123142050 [Triticum aestivum]